MHRGTIVDAYENQARQLTLAIAGLTPEQLAAVPVPDTWSIQQIVLHLMDSDLIASDRMKRVIAQDNPQLLAYDETAFCQRLFYNQADANMAAGIFRDNRLLTAKILRALPDAAFARAGVHNERGPMNLESLVKGYVEHFDHHLKFIKEKRRLVGNPL